MTDRRSFLAALAAGIAALRNLDAPEPPPASVPVKKLGHRVQVTQDIIDDAALIDLGYRVRIGDRSHVVLYEFEVFYPAPTGHYKVNDEWDSFVYSSPRQRTPTGIRLTTGPVDDPNGLLHGPPAPTRVEFTGRHHRQYSFEGVVVGVCRTIPDGPHVIDFADCTPLAEYAQV